MNNRRVSPGNLTLTLLAALVLLVGLVSSVSAAEADGKGTIKGTLANSTPGGGSVANLEVTLSAYTGTSQSGSQKVRVDQAGSFSFQGLDTTGNTIYQASVLYQDVTYYSPPVVLADDQAEQSVALKVFDSTSSQDALKAPARHYLVQPDPSGILVSEIIIIRNDSGKTYVGSREARPGARETLRFELPKGAQDVEYVDGFLESAIVPVDGGFVYTAPAYPGDSQYVYGYRIPFSGDSASFTTKLTMAVEKVNVLLPDIGLQISVSNLPNKSNQEMQGEKLVLVSGQNLAAGTELQFKLDGLSKALARAGAPAGAPSATASAPASAAPLVASGGIVLATLVGLSVFMLRRRRRQEVEVEEAEEEPADEAEAEAEEDELEIERRDLVAAIASLDDAYEQGRIGAEEYGMLRAQQKQRLLEIVELQVDRPKISDQREEPASTGGGQ